MFKKSINGIDATIFAFGNGGLNIALDLAGANLFEKYSIQYYDYNLEENEARLKNIEYPLTGGFRREIMESNNKLNDLIHISEELLNDGYPYGMSKTVIMCAALGGKSGSELAPYFALAATLQGRFVCSLYSLPAKFEGEKHLHKALESARKLKAASTIAVEQNNEELKSLYGIGLNDMNVPLIRTFTKVYQSYNYRLDENTQELNSLIPDEYKKTPSPIITIYNNGYRTTTYKQRIEAFEK